MYIYVKRICLEVSDIISVCLYSSEISYEGCNTVLIGCTKKCDYNPVIILRYLFYLEHI